MIACNIYFSDEKKQEDYAERFVDSLSPEEVQFCLNYLKPKHKCYWDSTHIGFKVVLDNKIKDSRRIFTLPDFLSSDSFKILGRLI